MKLSANKIIYPIVVLMIIAGIIAAFALVNKNPAPAYDFISAKKGDLAEEVNLPGNVKAAEQVDLAFERSGKISQINARVSDLVKSGQILAAETNTDLIAQLNQAQAAVANAEAMLKNYQAAVKTQQAKLIDMKNGARPEDLALSQSKIDNADKAITDAKIILNNTNDKAKSDLDILYAQSDDLLNDAALKASDALFNKTEGVFMNGVSDYPTLTVSFSDPQIANNLIPAKLRANQELAQLKNNLAQPITDQSVIETTLNSSLQHLTNLRNFLNSLNDDMNYVIVSASTPAAVITGDKANINLGLTNLNGAINELDRQLKAISTQKIVNTGLISATQSQLNLAQDNLRLARDELKLKKAGASAEQIMAQASAVDQAQASVMSQQAAIKQAQAAVTGYNAQLSKSVITSPLDGIVTRLDIKNGEIVAMNAPVISINSSAKFQLEAWAAEADIEKIKVGQSADVTLNADNNVKNFPAKVIAVDPSKTLDNGSPTYKVTLEFKNNDPLIKDGLTANLNIITSRKKEVLLIPSSSIIRQYDKTVVLINNNSALPEKRVITVGLSQNGLTEVLSGLTEGDKIANFGGEK